MNIQIIEREGKPEYAVIPFEEYERLLCLAEDRQDLLDAKKALSELARGEDEAIPGHIVERLMSGDEHPLKVWREYRGMTQEALGEAVGVGKSYISQIEAGKKTGSMQVLKALAEVLSLDVDDLTV